jgi:hypothetical protein|tara:strand:+ start:13135 stop:13638 length:504 start_codon:yes stop_codon:yes gene_type:complete
VNPEYADEALFLFQDIADSLELDWFLFAGTCLGIFRDGKYLPGDNDLDLGVKASPDRLEGLWAALYRAGFSLGPWCTNKDGSRNRHVYFKHGEPWPTKDGILVDVWYDFTEGELNLTMNYGQVRYKGRDFLVPYPVQSYLQDAYGEWWDTESRVSAAGKEGVSRVAQ